jgi:hypothetical protein
LSPNTVRGSIQAEEGGNFNSCGTILPKGSIQVKKSRDSTSMNIGGGLCVGLGSSVALGGGNTLEEGSIQVEDNIILSSPIGLNVAHNQVAQDLQVFKNKGPGSKTVQNNTVGENLQCFENDPPFVGGPNAAQKREGDCF